MFILIEPGEEEATAGRPGCEGGAFGSERKGRGFESRQVHPFWTSIYYTAFFIV